MNKFLLIILLSLVLFSCSEEAKDEIKYDDSKFISFNDSEVRYYEKIYHKSYGDCSDKKDCAELKVEYPEIISNGTYSDSINNYIQSQIYSLSFNEDNYKSLNEISDSLFSNYIEVQKEFDDYHIGWFINSKILIGGITNNILSIESEEVVYTGGANTFYNLTFVNFDILTGKTIILSDIVEPENIVELEKIGKTTFFDLKDIDANQTEEEAGFWFEKKTFELNDNFAITDSGLVFFYNFYEIASRAEGTTELFIPKEKIINLTNIYK